MAGTHHRGPLTITRPGLADVVLASADGTAGRDKGFINLDFNTARILATNAVQNTTEAGVPDGNTAPILARVNGATDIALRLTYAATVVAELQFNPVAKPPDLDITKAVTINLMLGKDANTDTTAVVGVKVFDGVGGSNLGGNTDALALAALAKKTVTVAAAAIAAAPGFLNIAILPGAHANDAIYLYAAWIEYTRV